MPHSATSCSSVLVDVAFPLQFPRKTMPTLRCWRVLCMTDHINMCASPLCQFQRRWHWRVGRNSARFPLADRDMPQLWAICSSHYHPRVSLNTVAIPSRSTIKLAKHERWHASAPNRAQGADAQSRLCVYTQIEHVVGTSGMCRNSAPIWPQSVQRMRSLAYGMVWRYRLYNTKANPRAWCFAW